MKVALTIQHPAHVHFFKPVIRHLHSEGIEVRVYARAKDLVVDLLTSYDITHEILSHGANSMLRLLVSQIGYEYRLFRRLRQWRPDIVAAIGGLEASHAASAAGVPSLVFTDSELRSNLLMAPFADVICTPRGFRGDFGEKHRRYDGFHELAYLHPNRFEPDPTVLEYYGVHPSAPYSVIRFSAMGASHDLGHDGFSTTGKEELHSTLAAFGPVYVASEGSTGESSLPVPPHHLHHLLAFASLVVTDSSTTATEAGLLGTPAIRSTTFASGEDMSNFVELGDRFGLVFSTANEREAIAMSHSILADPSSQDRWQHRRQQLLEEKIDVVPFIIDLVHELASGPDAEPLETATPIDS